MRWKFVANITGLLILVLGAAMIIPLTCALICRDSSIVPILKALAITLCAGSLIYILFRNEQAEIITQREGIAIVAFGWIAICILGALPFYFDHHFKSLTDALFESVSGFTTTGSSILNNIEGLPRGLLFWRSFIQWLGGMGIILLSVAILPFLGVGGMQLYKAEVPTPVPDKLKPRIRETAILLWKVYLLISLVECFLLYMGGMTLFDALCHTFTTMPTGGFSTKNSSIAYFNSIYIDSVIIFFMLIAGINFALHYQMLKGKPLMFWRDPECRFFLGLVFFLILIISFNVYKTVYTQMGEAVRFGAFQAVSIVTTTGYATGDYEKWPAMSQLILMLCMFIGASAGSTGGGMKCLRIMLCIKYCYKELFLLIHPRSIIHIKLGGKPVSEDVIKSVLGFLALYIILFAICSVLLASMGIDLITSLSAVASAIGNIGPGLGSVGPMDNYAHIPVPGKWLLIWCMLLGRLEIFTVIILLVPEFWRK
ncbi:MAG TPA: potassium transporter [Desulfobacteraceae bacterium]|nr:potassium transporter [Desulfobacteraceae bacterium]